MKKRTVASCYISMAAYAAVLTVTGPLLPKIAQTFSLDVAQSGIVFSADYIGFVAFVLVAAAVADRIGKKQLLFISLAGMAVSLLGVFASPCFAAVCAFLFFVGGFSSVVESMISALLSDLDTDHPEHAVNMSQIFFGIGALVGPVAAGIAVSAGVPWQRLYLALAVLMAAVALAFLPVKKPRDVNTHGSATRGLRVLACDRRFLTVCLCMFFYSGAEVGSWGWLSTYLTVDRGATLAAAGAAVSLLWGAVIAGRLVCGKLAHKFKSGKLVPLLAFITALALVLLAAAPGNLPVWPVILLVGLGYSSQWPFIAAYGASLHKEYSGASYALLIGSCGVGMSVIPGLLGIVGKKAGMRAAMGSPAVLLILVGAIFLFLNFKGGARE